MDLIRRLLGSPVQSEPVGDADGLHRILDHIQAQITEKEAYIGELLTIRDQISDHLDVARGQIDGLQKTEAKIEAEIRKAEGIE